MTALSVWARAADHIERVSPEAQAEDESQEEWERGVAAGLAKLAYAEAAARVAAAMLDEGLAPVRGESQALREAVGILAYLNPGGWPDDPRDPRKRLQVARKGLKDWRSAVEAACERPHLEAEAKQDQAERRREERQQEVGAETEGRSAAGPIPGTIVDPPDLPQPGEYPQLRLTYQEAILRGWRVEIGRTATGGSTR